MKCKKCGAELPENAVTCPGCNTPVSQTVTLARPLFLAIVIVLALAVLVGVVGYFVLTGQNEASFEAGRQAGLVESSAEAYEAGFEAGKTEGIAEGTETGYEDGFAAGTEAGILSGREEGFAEGREAGYAAGIADMKEQIAGLSRLVSKMLQREMSLLDTYLPNSELLQAKKESIVSTYNLFLDTLAEEYELEGLVPLSLPETASAAEAPAEPDPSPEEVPDEMPDIDAEIPESVTGVPEIETVEESAAEAVGNAA